MPFTAQEFALKTIDQVSIVVKDIQMTIEQYWKILGIGPWSIYTLAPPELNNTIVRGRSERYSMKMAFTHVGSTMLELLQPLEGRSIQREFLDEKGEGLHHIASYEVDDLDLGIALLEKRGIRVLQRGTWVRGSTVASHAFMDTEKTLGVIVELAKRIGGFPKPDDRYPCTSG